VGCGVCGTFFSVVGYETFTNSRLYCGDREKK